MPLDPIGHRVTQQSRGQSRRCESVEDQIRRKTRKEHKAGPKQTSSNGCDSTEFHRWVQSKVPTQPVPSTPPLAQTLLQCAVQVSTGLTYTPTDQTAVSCPAPVSAEGVTLLGVSVCLASSLPQRTSPAMSVSRGSTQADTASTVVPSPSIGGPKVDPEIKVINTQDARDIESRALRRTSEGSGPPIVFDQKTIHSNPPEDTLSDNPFWGALLPVRFPDAVMRIVPKGGVPIGSDVPTDTATAIVGPIRDMTSGKFVQVAIPSGIPSLRSGPDTQHPARALLEIVVQNMMPPEYKGVDPSHSPTLGLLMFYPGMVLEQVMPKEPLAFDAILRSSRAVLFAQRDGGRIQAVFPDREGESVFLKDAEGNESRMMLPHLVRMEGLIYRVVQHPRYKESPVGHIIYENGAVFSGAVDSDGLPHGPGCLTDANGVKTTGSFKHGAVIGHAHREHPDGRVYEGVDIYRV